MAPVVEYIEVDKEAIKKRTKYNNFMAFINFVNAISKVSLMIGGIFFILNIPLSSFSELVRSIFSNLFLIYVLTYIILLIHSIYNLKNFK